MKYIKWFMLLLLSLCFIVISYLAAPLLPLFASPSWGATDNNNSAGTEPRLPSWLSWFMTPDNSLWGDHTWQTKHCQEYKSYWGMVKWLWRNHAYGFNWTVLAATISKTERVMVSGDLSISKTKPGKLYIEIGNYWQFKLIKHFGAYGISINLGWMLDPYVKNTALVYSQPKALFLFSPRLFTIPK